MITVYRIRHTETGIDENNPRKKKPSKNLNALGRKNGQKIARYLADKNITSIFTSQFTRSNELGYIVARHLNNINHTNLKVISTPLLNEWWIPSIWGKKYNELNQYLHWRSKTFQELNLDSHFDKNSETLRQLLFRTISFNQLLSSLDGNAVYIGHSQYIATDLASIHYGPNVDPTNLVKGFNDFFPKQHGNIAITCLNNGLWTILDPSYTSHLA